MATASLIPVPAGVILPASSLTITPELCTIALTFATHKDTLTIPTDAIITLDNQSKIFIVKDNKAIEVKVNKGFVQEQLTEIMGDLSEGDMVVVNGHHNLKANALVEVLNAEPNVDIKPIEQLDTAIDTAIAKTNK